MATITTDTYLDGGTARTAGEAWTCNGGILTVRTDTRWHANAPASMTGSLGSVTVSATLGGGFMIDARNVRWLEYNSGTGNVPAIGTTVSQGGVSGYLLGVWSSYTSAPTAVGAAMPATGYIKFREVTGGAFSAGALSGIGASATGADTTGWIEVVMDQSAAITVSRKGIGSVTRGDWFYLGTTSGSAAQVVQVPTNGGGATTQSPGLWIETGENTDEYEFWPALSSAANGWAVQHIGQPRDNTDSRTQFVKDIGSGQLQIGELWESASLAYTITTSSGTYTWASNEVTVTLSAHGYSVGEQVYLDFTSGAATADGTYTVKRVPSTSTFVVDLSGSGTGGNVSFRGRVVLTYTSQPFAVGNTFYLNVTSGSVPSGTYAAIATATNSITLNVPVSGTTTGNATLRQTIGHVPSANRRIRVPNIFLRQCATGSRATNAAPNATIANRPDFTTTGAGVVDHEYTYGDWYYLTLQAYTTKLNHVATFDAISVSECATEIVLNDGGCGMYGALDVVTLTLTSNFAGAEITDWRAQRGNAPGSNDHAVSITTCSGMNFTRGRCGIVQFARSSGYPINMAQSDGTVISETSMINGTLALVTCSDIEVNDLDYVDRYIGFTNTGAYSAVTISAKSDSIKIDGMTLGLNGAIPRVHPYTALLSTTASSNIRMQNIGSRTMPLTPTNNGINAPAAVWTSGGNNANISVKRCYLGMVRTGPSVTVNSDKGIREESVYGILAGTGMASAHTPSAINQQSRGVGSGSNSVAANASVYGTHIYDLHTSDTTGRVVCIFNEPTVETASQVTYVAGTPQFTSVPSLSNPSVGDEVIVEMDYFALGHTGFENTAPTLTGTNTGNMTFTYQIDLGSGYNGTWLTLNTTNLTTHTIDPAIGFKMKFRVVTATANTTNAITHIRVNTLSTFAAQRDNLYPLDPTIATLELTGLKTNSEVRVFRVSDDQELAGIENSGTSFSYQYEHTGTDTDIYIVVHALGWLPIRYEGVSLTANGLSIPVQQTIDRQYANS